MTNPVADPQVYEFKYLVAFNAELKQFMVGWTRTWKYHIDIYSKFPKGYRPYGAGYFSMQGDDVETIKVFGSSEGFNIGPSFYDVDMLKHLMSEGVNTFDINRMPL